MKRGEEKLSKQVKRHAAKPAEIEKPYEGNFGQVISTGSTLLDLAISGGVVHGGGIPGGILVEAFGPSGSGKSVLLCEIGGGVQRAGGDIKFYDPEARLNSQFAKQFDLSVSTSNYSRPSQVPEIFSAIPDWKPENPKIINGIFADSLAALSTDMEMTAKEGDKMGGRRAKEFSEGLRKTCRILAEKNLLMVCSNQIREVMGAMPFEEKYKSPGGTAIGFYSSLRLKFGAAQKITEKQTINGNETKRVIGVNTKIEVYKSSIWKPFRSADVTIIFDYGIDDIRQNLQFVKDYSKYSVYTLNDQELDKSMDKSIQIIEEDNLQGELREQVIKMWMEIEHRFDSNRTKKVRV